MRQSKEHLRSEIEQLRLQKRSSDQVFAALMRPEAWEEVMERLRSGHSVEDISEWLNNAPSTRTEYGQQGGISSSISGISSFTGAGSGPAPLSTLSLGPSGSIVSPATAQHTTSIRPDLDPNSPWHFSSHSHSTRSNSHADSMNWSADVNRPPQNRIGFWGDSLNAEPDENTRYRGLDQILAPLESPQMKQPTTTWSSVTTDVVLVQHLLALYFCWEYPTFASLSKEHFLRDFQDGIPRYCSPILVNALLALGCRFSTKASTRAYPNDPYSSGDHFFKECQRLFYQEEDHHNLTTIQALGIMSIREASCGRDSESWFYAGQSIRLAVEMGLHRVNDKGDEDQLAVQAATFWGAFALDQ